MPVYLTLSAFGAFVLNEQNEVIARHVIYPDEQLAVSNLLAISKGEKTDAIESMASEIIKLGTNEVFVEDQMLARSLSQVEGIIVSVSDDGTTKWFRENLGEYLSQLGIVKSQEEISSFRYNVAIRLSKAKLSAASAEKDLLVKNAIDAIDEVDKAINILVMRAREWYSFHHPTLSELIQDQDQFAQILKFCCGKDKMTKACLEKIGLPESTIEQILKAVIGDIGPDMKEDDLTIIQNLAQTIDGLYNTRKELEAYVTTVMGKISPNMTALVGPLIGARLISLAGSLKELARKPSSTIQVYGAEKALFRSLKTGADPPKHGIIYRVTEINSAPYWQRGKIARALAGKLSIASRIDAYAERDVGDSLREAFLFRVEEIRKQNPEAPVKQVKPPKPEEKRKQPQRGRDKGKKRDRRNKREQGGRR
ncbi:MAG: C/D box methylation guide ribonucleoprotein complex aNOP56 subunit [Candidatus Thorarchaeota archaeon]|nr:C/D box methylation guide ribonucleoprotein complex aNOP56 subunit [Candidatus Thorarchaeota archaeon]